MEKSVLGFSFWMVTLTVQFGSFTHSASLVTCDFGADFCGWTPTAVGGIWERYSGSSVNGIRPPSGVASFAYILSGQESYANLESQELNLNSASALRFRVVQMRSEFSSSNNMAELVVVPSDGSAQTILWNLRNTQSQFGWTNPYVEVALRPDMGGFKLKLRFKVGSMGSTAAVASIILLNELYVLAPVMTSTQQSTALMEPLYLPTGPIPTTAPAPTTDSNISCPFTPPVTFQCRRGVILVSEHDLEDSTATSAVFNVDSSNECRGILFDVHQWIVGKTQNRSKMSDAPIVIDCRSKGRLHVSDADVSGSSASTIFFNSTPNPKCQLVFHAFLQFLSDI